MCALRDAYIGDGRSSLQKRCLAAATQPPALFIGYRIDCALQFGLPRAGVSAPPPLVSPLGFSPSSGGGTEPPRHSSGDGLRVELRRFFITFAAVCFAPVGRAAELSRQPRGPPPRVFRAAGTPAPLFRPPPRYAGERLSLRSHFFSATALGGGGGGWVRLTRPRVRVGGVRPAPFGRAAPPRRRVRCVRSRRVLACATRPAAPFGRVRAAAAAPHRVRVARIKMSWVSQKNRLHYGIPAPDLRGTRFFWEPSLRHFHSRLRLHLLRSGALPP